MKTAILTLLTALFLAPLAALQAADASRVSKDRPDGTVNRAAWMAEGSFGVMVHYLVKPSGQTRSEQQASVNRTVNAFDLDGFMRQFEQTRADWLIFTLTQVNGVLNSPNPRLDSSAPILVPQRDLVLEIAERLEGMNKRLILYLPSIQIDPRFREQLNFPAPCAPAYRQFVRAYSHKFGKRHHGWWFDSCAALPDAEWKDWLNACRAGNPDAVVAFSGAEFCTGGPLEPLCKLEDYHAGEIHLLDGGRIRRDFLPPGGQFSLTPDGVMRQPGREPRYYLPSSQFIGGVQWHGLLPIDQSFNPAIPNRLCRYSDKELFQFVAAVKAVGGAITINVPIEQDSGLIPADSHAQLVRLGCHQ